MSRRVRPCGSGQAQPTEKGAERQQRCRGQRIPTLDRGEAKPLPGCSPRLPGACPPSTPPAARQPIARGVHCEPQRPWGGSAGARLAPVAERGAQRLAAWLGAAGAPRPERKEPPGGGGQEQLPGGAELTWGQLRSWLRPAPAAAPPNDSQHAVPAAAAQSRQPSGNPCHGRNRPLAGSRGRCWGSLLYGGAALGADAASTSPEAEGPTVELAAAQDAPRPRHQHSPSPVPAAGPRPAARDRGGAAAAGLVTI
eukprot:TRINITY_DN29589_c0_g1_i3.p2 TRINITY_DN29589_c0_g1~~TRINITY_DN29589_c0_g1_i3.p2  ORF type:complete len:253 (+),score=17.91 TRINITY_DN29589_c0_g1_i3:83-841(+)